MPSPLHETIVELFRDHPALAAELLRDELRLPLPDFDEIFPVDASLSELVPTAFLVDHLQVLRRGGVPVLCLAVEAQLRRDERKRYSWPVYGTVGRARYECDSCVLVVTPHESVARWAQEAIALGGGNMYKVVVIGPGDLPRPTAERARAYPHLAMLSTLAHARSPDDAPLVVQMLGILGEVRGSDAVVYHQLMLASLDEAVRVAVEALMKTITPETIDPILKPAYMKGREEGVEVGLERGRALAILSVLAARGLALSDDQRALVLACRDGALLETWLGRAAVAKSIDEVLAGRQ